jgi:hypothetical protein
MVTPRGHRMAETDRRVSLGASYKFRLLPRPQLKIAGAGPSHGQSMRSSECREIYTCFPVLLPGILEVLAHRPASHH